MLDRPLSPRSVLAVPWPLLHFRCTLADLHGQLAQRLPNIQRQCRDALLAMRWPSLLGNVARAGLCRPWPIRGVVPRPSCRLSHTQRACGARPTPERLPSARWVATDALTVAARHARQVPSACAALPKHLLPDCRRARASALFSRLLTPSHAFPRLPTPSHAFPRLPTPSLVFGRRARASAVSVQPIRRG